MVDGLTLTLDLSKLPREFETTPSEAVTALVEFAVDVGASDLFSSAKKMLSPSQCGTWESSVSFELTAVSSALGC